MEKGMEGGVPVRVPAIHVEGMKQKEKEAAVEEEGGGCSQMVGCTLRRGDRYMQGGFDMGDMELDDTFKLMSTVVINTP